MDKQIKIKLVIEEAKDKDGKGNIITSKDPETGRVNYARNDSVGLLELLGKLDTKRHPLNSWKQSMKVKDKLTNAYLKDLKEIELSLDEASFLKLYLKEFSEKEGKEMSIKGFELKTLFGILEQFSE